MTYSEAFSTQTFTSSLQEVPSLLEFIRRITQQSHIHPTKQINLEVAAEEAFVNILKHGYKEVPGTIEVSVHLDLQKAHIHLKDNAPACNPLLYKEPEGHFGLTLLQSLADEIRYQRQDEHNILSLSLQLGEYEHC